MKYLFVVVIILNVSIIKSQQINVDTTGTKINYELDLGAGTYYQFTTFGNTNFNTVETSNLLQRRRDNPIVRNLWGLNGDLVSDNPFFHGSYFFKFGVEFSIGKKLGIAASLNAEQRGFSDGIFSRRTRNFYPYFNARYSNKKGKFSYLFQVGDFRNLKLYEGLTFDNLETQSWVFKLKYGNFYIKHVGIGDLVIGIGLGIDDLYDYSTGVENVKLNQDSTLNFDLRLGYSLNRRSVGGGFWNFSTKIGNGELYSIYSQLSINNSGNTAFLIGINTQVNLVDGLEITTSAEFRSYSSEFNFGYENNVFYRDPQNLASFTNSTNNVFIPLDYYERNFNQWAVFTEYQNINIRGLNIRSKVKYNFGKKLFINMNLDLNWLISEEENILHPFYSFGIGVNPIASTEVSLELNNKVLNLDKNFPSFYSSNNPYFILRLYKPLKFTRENDQLHRT